MIKPKVGIKLLHARIFSVLLCQNLFLVSLLFVAVKGRSLLTFKFAFQVPKNVTGAYLIMFLQALDNKSVNMVKQLRIL